MRRPRFLRPLKIPPPSIKDPRDTRLLALLKPYRGRAQAGIGLLALPYDGATLGRKGAGRGPRALLEALRFFSSFTPPAIDLRGAEVRVFGEAVVPQEIKAAHSAAKKAASYVLGRAKVALFIGGDHSLTYPCFSAALRGASSASLVYFDAHLDLRDGPPSSGNGVRWALEEAQGRARAVNVGARPFGTAEPYFRRASELGISIIAAEEAEALGEELPKRLLELVEGSDLLYVSVDADVLDASYAPGVSSPGISGMTPRLLAKCLYALALRGPLRAADFCELAPNFDPAGITALSLAYCFAWLLAGLAGRAT
jgi:formiminoglutamase